MNKTKIVFALLAVLVVLAAPAYAQAPNSAAFETGISNRGIACGARSAMKRDITEAVPAARTERTR